MEISDMDDAETKSLEKFSLIEKLSELLDEEKTSDRNLKELLGIIHAVALDGAGYDLPGDTIAPVTRTSRLGTKLRITYSGDHPVWGYIRWTGQERENR